MKRRGMALGLAALMTCTALFTTTAEDYEKMIQLAANHGKVFD